MTPYYRGALYRSFDLFPLPAGDPAYVDCVDVRGDRDVVQELADVIDFAEPGKFTCQLYTGARGCGKSTELLRLEKRLTDSGYTVVYLEADRGDIEIEDTEHTDILLACARSILSQLEDVADPKPLLLWLQQRLERIKDLVLLEVGIDSGADAIPTFMNLMSKFKAVPEVRHEVRHQVELQMPSLLEILNHFLDEAHNNLAARNSTEHNRGIVVIVDNLDRIVPVWDKAGRSNHEKIFLDRHNLMRGLKCHVIYTVPISMVYSSYSSNLVENYGQTIVMPMVMVKQCNGRPYLPGIDCLQNMLIKRLKRDQIPMTLAELFAEPKQLDLLCEKSGGYLRNFMQLMQAVVKHSAKLPIQEMAVTRASSEMREIYRRSIYGEEWKLLAEVSISKSISKDNAVGAYRDLLFRRCVLEYYQTNPDGALEAWYSVHPLIEEMEQFQAAKAELEDSANGADPSRENSSQKNGSPELHTNIKQTHINLKSISVFDQESPLIRVMNEAEQEYIQFIEEKRYGEAAEIAKKIHDMWEEQVESMKHNPKSDDYIAAVAWSSYWHLRYNIYNARS